MCKTLKITIFYMASIFWYMNLIQNMWPTFCTPLPHQKTKCFLPFLEGVEGNPCVPLLNPYSGKYQPGKVVYTLELPSQHLLVQSQQQKYLKKVWNLFKVNKKMLWHLYSHVGLLHLKLSFPLYSCIRLCWFTNTRLFEVMRYPIYIGLDISKQTISKFHERPTSLKLGDSRM